MDWKLEIKVTFKLHGDARVDSIMESVKQALVRQMEEAGITDSDDDGFVTGFTVENPMSPSLEYKNPNWYNGETI